MPSALRVGVSKVLPNQIFGFAALLDFESVTENLERLFSRKNRVLLLPKNLLDLLFLLLVLESHEGSHRALKLRLLLLNFVSDVSFNFGYSFNVGLSHGLSSLPQLFNKVTVVVSKVYTRNVGFVAEYPR